MEAPTIEEVLAYIEAHTQRIPRRVPGMGITATEYARANNCSGTTARRRLRKLVASGKLVRREAIDGDVGAVVVVYYPPGTEEAVFET